MSAFQEYFVDTFKKKYADFSGRASRSEYWFFTLFLTLISIPLFIILLSSVALSDGASDSMPISSKISLVILMLFAFAIIIPSLAITVRRLHDVGRSGWWYLITLVPLGGLVLFIFTLLESESGRNKWGPNPWEPDGEDTISQHLIEDYDKL